MRPGHIKVGVMVLTVLTAISAVMPATVAGGQKAKEVEVLFISRAQLEAAGAMPSDAVGPTAQDWCLYDCIYAAHRVFTGTVNVFVTRVSGDGPATLALEDERTVSNSFAATVSIGADKVSATLGFSVTWSASRTYRYSTVVPDGACWTVRAYNVINTYKFEVWNDAFVGPDMKLGTGTASRFMGLRFTLTKSC